MRNIIEIKVDEYFDSYNGNELIRCLLSNGYALTLTPTKYNDNKYSIMIEIGEVDESFCQESLLKNIMGIK